jgi:type IV secretory pathway TraG/TraD family ATPase VirD4
LPVPYFHVVFTTTATNFRRGNTLLGERSVSKSLTGVPLMRADEVIRLPKQSSILMIANERPILTRKIRYDKDPAASPASANRCFVAFLTCQRSMSRPWRS